MNKYIPSKEQKQNYLNTYKNKPCYNLQLNCCICNATYIKACEQSHLKSKKHLFNMKVYEEAQQFIITNKIINEEEQIKIFYDIKNKNLYQKYLNKIKPNNNENINKLFNIKTI